MQAALSSPVSFAFGGVVPLLAGIFSSGRILIPVLAIVSLVFLAMLGALAARTGGAPILRGAARVLILGAVAMCVTGAIGALFGTIL